MKISKTVLQALAAAVVITSVVACTDSDGVGPEKEKGSKTRKAEPCPACGLG